MGSERWIRGDNVAVTTSIESQWLLVAFGLDIGNFPDIDDVVPSVVPRTVTYTHLTLPTSDLV